MPISLLDYLADHEDELVNDLIAFVRIPSLSGSPDRKPDILKAAEWLVARMRRAGIENVEILQTDGHPTVYGDWLHAGTDAQTVLIYGHYDVQPSEPNELWETPAFEPAVRDGKLFGRGAADDKGGVAAGVAAVEALLKTGELPSVNIKFCFEGEEEIGSPNLAPLIERERERFAADLVVSVDGGHWSAEQPQLVLGLRGATVAELHVTGPSSDLHSGLYGGAVLNPLEAISRILASMRSPDGRITIEGFYDDVVTPSEQDRAAIARIPGGADEIREATGVPALHGEPGYTPREHTWIRPTLEINGIWGGYSGPGLKTVIPAEAHAKISCRLVANQDPDRVRELLAAHVARHTPVGVKARLDPLPGRATPYSISADYPANKLLSEILNEIYGVAPYETRVGGSVPVVPVFQDLLNAPTITVGCSTLDCCLHAPNEFVHLRTLHRGTMTVAMLLRRLGVV